MAVLKFGAIVTEGSGSLGGHTIQNSKGGFQIRNKPIPHGNPSASQLLIRSINQQLQAGWHQLTSSQQKIWNDWPVTHGIQAQRMPHNPISGHSLWMKYNFSWIRAGGGFLQGPWEWGGPILGPELILNGTFNSALYWTLQAAWSIHDGYAHYVAGADQYMQTPAIIQATKQYRFKFLVLESSPANLSAFRSDTGNYLFLAPLREYQNFPPGDYTYTAVCDNSSTAFRVYSRTAGTVFKIDNVSLRQII